MPNGHHPCCASGCTYGSETHGVPKQATCDVFGIETDLHGGCLVYFIRNAVTDEDWCPQPVHRVTPVS